MPLTPLTKLLGGLLFTLGALGASTAVDGGGTTNPSAVVDSTELIQSRTAVARTQMASNDSATDYPYPNKDTAQKENRQDADKVVLRPAMQKLIEMNATMNLLKALSQATPEVNAVVNVMIKTIKDEIDPQIKNDQADAQSAVDTTISTLSTRTTDAVGKKTAADAADKAMDDCFAQQQRLLILHETCTSEEATLRDEKDKDCNHPHLYSSNGDQSVGSEGLLQLESASLGEKTYPLPENLKADLTCDFSTGNCIDVRDARKNEHDTWLTDLSIVEDKANYDAAHANCKAATERLESKIASCTTMWSNFGARYAQCLDAFSAQHLTICMFGDILRSKCETKSNYDTLINEIEGTGKSHSESDRATEWRAVNKLKCMLGEFVGGANFDNAMVDQCTTTDAVAEADFAQNVGIIDKKNATYTSLIAEENFSCTETAITFTGVTWTVPLGGASAHTSSAYLRETGQSYPIDFGDNAAPFKICSVYGPSPTCESFYCGSQTQGDPLHKCRLAGGCTKADCCVKVAQCGDSVVQAGEECDDGNAVAGDGCSATCTHEV